MSNNFTDRYISHLFHMSQSILPDRVTHQAKICLLDYLAVTIAGAALNKKKGLKFLDLLNSSQSNATIIGYNRKASIQNAALINGMSAHLAELDDGVRFGMIHPGAPIISALIPLAEKEKINGSQLLKSIIVGYEAAVTVARSIQPSHKELGYHATGTCGTIGTAIGCASALNMSENQMKNALSAAATTSSGILEVIEGESELKPFNAGSAAYNGLVSAFMSKAGFKGPADVLAGKRGFLKVMAKECNFDNIEKDNNESYGIEKVYRKPYAACRHSHPAMEAAINLKEKYGINIEQIREIKISTYRWAVEGHDHCEIEGVSSAKMSTPFSVAVAIKFGKAGLNEFTEQTISDLDLTSLAKKIKVNSNEELTSLVPQKRAAIVEIITNGNKIFMERIDYPKGEPENPLTEKEIEDKFLSLALFSKMPVEDVEKIIQYVWDLENKKELDSLFTLL